MWYNVHMVRIFKIENRKKIWAAIILSIILIEIFLILTNNQILVGIWIGVGMVIINWAGINIKIEKNRFGLNWRDFIEWILFFAFFCMKKMNIFHDTVLAVTIALAIRGMWMVLLKSVFMHQYFTSIENLNKNNISDFKIGHLIIGYIKRIYKKNI